MVLEMVESENTESKSDGKYVPIVHSYPDNLESKFVNHAVVQRTQHGMYYLSFFEVIPPAVIADEEEERKKKIEQIESVTARCVVRLVMTADQIKGVVGAIAENLKRAIAIEEAETKSGLSSGVLVGGALTKHAG